MAVHFSILAWEIPWAEEPGGLQSMGSWRVRLDLVTKQQQQGWIHCYCFIFIFMDIHLLTLLAPSFDLCGLWQGHLVNICRVHLLFPSQLLCFPAEWGMTKWLKVFWRVLLTNETLFEFWQIKKYKLKHHGWSGLSVEEFRTRVHQLLGWWKVRPALCLIRSMANGQRLGREIIDSLIRVMFTPRLSTVIICLTWGLLGLLWSLLLGWSLQLGKRNAYVSLYIPAGTQPDSVFNYCRGSCL